MPTIFGSKYYYYNYETVCYSINSIPILLYQYINRKQMNMNEEVTSNKQSNNNKRKKKTKNEKKIEFFSLLLNTIYPKLKDRIIIAISYG